MALQSGTCWVPGTGSVSLWESPCGHGLADVWDTQKAVPWAGCRSSRSTTAHPTRDSIGPRHRTPSTLCIGYSVCMQATSPLQSWAKRSGAMTVMYDSVRPWDGDWDRPTEGVRIGRRGSTGGSQKRSWGSRRQTGRTGVGDTRHGRPTDCSTVAGWHLCKKYYI